MKEGHEYEGGFVHVYDNFH